MNYALLQVRFTGEAPTLTLTTTLSDVDIVPCISPLAGYFADSFSFLYIVSPGDATGDLSYASPTALSLGNTTDIVDENGGVANITLPEVGFSLSETGDKGMLVVDTSNVVVRVTSLSDDGVYYAGASIFIQVICMC